MKVTRMLWLVGMLLLGCWPHLSLSSSHHPTPSISSSHHPTPSLTSSHHPTPSFSSSYHLTLSPQATLSSPSFHHKAPLFTLSSTLFSSPPLTHISFVSSLSSVISLPRYLHLTSPLSSTPRSVSSSFPSPKQYPYPQPSYTLSRDSVSSHTSSLPSPHPLTTYSSLRGTDLHSLTVPGFSSYSPSSTLPFSLPRSSYSRISSSSSPPDPVSTQISPPSTPPFPVSTPLSPPSLPPDDRPVPDPSSDAPIARHQQESQDDEEEPRGFFFKYILAILTALRRRNTSFPYPVPGDDEPQENHIRFMQASNSSSLLVIPQSPAPDDTSKLSGENTNDIISTITNTQSENKLRDTFDAEDNSTTTASTETASTQLPSTPTQDGTTTPRPSEFSIPRCCFDQEEATCPTESTDGHNPSLPITLGRCGVPVSRPFVYNVIHNLSCPSNELETSVLGEASKIVYINNDIYLSVNQVVSKEFCLETDVKNTSSVWIVSCLPQPPGRCPEQRCFRKCCAEGYVLQNRSCVCHEGSSYFPTLFISLLGNINGPNSEKETEFGLPSCLEALSIPYNYSENNLKLLPNGSLLIVNESRTTTDYCLDDYLEEDGAGAGVRETIMALVCPSQPRLPKSTWSVVRGVLIPAGLVVSCVFLGATLLCHLCVAPLRDLHGLCLAAYVAALLVADATLFLTQAFSRFFPPAACVAMAVVLHVAFLSTFFWLNVICYDVWNYVGLTVQAIPLYRRADDLRIFVAYAVYAWGCPLVIGGVAVTIHFLPQHIDWLLRPDFVQNRCWFRDGEEILAYFYGPMGVLCLANTLLICHTGLRLYCADQRCTCLPPSCCTTASHALYTTHMTEFWQRFTLFGLMVACWVMEVVSWLVGPADSELWALTDTLNTFQGVFIFITFLRSSKKRRLLQQQLAKWSAAGGGRGGAPLNPPRLPAATRLNKVLLRVRQSGFWEATVRLCSRWQAGRPHLTRQQILNKIIFRRKQEASQNFRNEGFEEDSREIDDGEGEKDVGKAVGGEDSTGEKFSPIWTMPSWRSHWSQSYFPNVFRNSKQEQDAFWTNMASGIDDRKQDSSLSDPAQDTVNTSYTTMSTIEGGPSSVNTPPEQRPTFPGWSFVRQKSWSLRPWGPDTRAGNGEVVCQGLTRRDTILN